MLRNARLPTLYDCRFGGFGSTPGRFNEPCGVAVNALNDIIVADTNNHRIQVFDKDGHFLFQFGTRGTRNGELWFPNRVAVVKTSGVIVVTERSPMHQIQIYNRNGQFVRNFGADVLKHPRGLTVDRNGWIVVVDCRKRRIIMFDQLGNVRRNLNCRQHLDFPNGIVVNDEQEIFISDYRAHCVKVFNYAGQYLRQIGGRGITNYPIGVGIYRSGRILIVDNFTRFHLTVFDPDGQPVSALQSINMHAPCFDVALMDDASLVVASRDYELYIYRYVLVPAVTIRTTAIERSRRYTI